MTALRIVDQSELLAFSARFGGMVHAARGGLCVVTTTERLAAAEVTPEQAEAYAASGFAIPLLADFGVEIVDDTRHFLIGQMEDTGWIDGPVDRASEPLWPESRPAAMEHAGRVVVADEDEAEILDLLTNGRHWESALVLMTADVLAATTLEVAEIEDFLESDDYDGSPMYDLSVALGGSAEEEFLREARHFTPELAREIVAAHGDPFARSFPPTIACHVAYREAVGLPTDQFGRFV